MTAVALRRSEIYWAPLLAALLALAAVVAGWQGVDLPASLYRVALFHRDGLTLWDSQWYGGHWTLNYSVIFPPVAGLLGVEVTAIASAMAAALTFDRLVTAHFGRAARVGSLVFAVGTLAQVAIGQLPFLLGEALGLAALWTGVRGRRRGAIALALASALASPLAGAFLALAACAWALSRGRALNRTAVAIGAAALCPVVISELLFPGQGNMPFPLVDFAFLAGLFVLAVLLVPARERALRIGAALYLLAIVASFLAPTAVGGNISRLGECVGAPLLTCVLWPQRRFLLLALVAIPIATLQWGPASASFSADGANPSRQAAYFQPLLGFLASHAAPAGRVEVVPTQLHWEAADVAPYAPLARGWERQLDTQNNALFYTDGALTPASYRAWLIDNGVRYVALPDVPLDYAGVAEAGLIRAGLPGLREVRATSHWRIYAVRGSPGIVSGPARLLKLDGAGIVLDVRAAGTIVVRERYSTSWSVSEDGACLNADPNGWMRVVASRPGTLHLQVGLGSAGAGC